jgi:hypothetical protein
VKEEHGQKQAEPGRCNVESSRHSMLRCGSKWQDLSKMMLFSMILAVMDGRKAREKLRRKW